MIVAVLLTSLGISMGIVLVQRFALRFSGVLVVPLLAVYTLIDFTVVPLFGLATGCAYVGLSLIRSRTFWFGRQVLLAGIVIGAAVPLLVVGGLAVTGRPHPDPAALALLGSVLPGVAAYNYHQLDDRRRRIDDLVASLAAYVGLVVLGVAFVNVSFAPVLGRVTPPLLFAENADVARLRGTWVGTPTGRPTASLPAVLLALTAGVAAAEIAYNRWGIRLCGIVAMPLLALFALQHGVVVALYVGGVACCFAVVSLLHRVTLLYGRVLLATSIVVAVIGTTALTAHGPTAPGSYLYFTAILIGVGAYNLHRVSPAHRPGSIAVSAATFTLLFAGLTIVAEPGPHALGSEHGLALGLVAAGAVLAGIRTTRRQECLRCAAPRRTATIETPL